MSGLLIKNGRLIDPDSGFDGRADLLLKNGKIIKIGSGLKAGGVKTIDAQDCWVIPGLIDMHTHLRDPGRPDKETIASGTRAAALGGFTTIACMANTDPPMDNPAVVEYVLAKAKAEGVVNVLPIAAITKRLQGEELAEMGRCYREGAVAFSDDGRPVMRADVMRRALEYARQFGVPIISHCEELSLSAGKAMNEGALSTEIGLPGSPALAEEIMVAREIMLAREYGRVHIAHVSTAGSVALVRRAKKDKISVTCETCPHYFSLTEAAVKEYDTNAKVNPPLRTPQDVKAIIAGLRDGTIDVIATDHAPHTIEEKNVEFNQAASGLIGLETALSLVITKLIKTKLLSPKAALAKMTIIPAIIFGLAEKGRLQAGAAADITIVDPAAEWVVGEKPFASRSANTPFRGWRLNGQVRYTIVGGRIVVKDGLLV